MKILIIIEEENTREKIKKLLEDNYEMILTDSVKQGVAVTKNVAISRILIDENNFEAAQKNIQTIKILPIKKWDIDKQKILNFLEP